MCPINKARRLLFIVEQICIDVCFHDIVQGYYWFQRLDLEKNKISLTILLITAQSNVQYPIFTPFIHWMRTFAVQHLSDAYTHSQPHDQIKVSVPRATFLNAYSVRFSMGFVMILRSLVGIIQCLCFLFNV